MQIGEECSKNLFVNMELEKKLLNTHPKKHLSMLILGNGLNKYQPRTIQVTTITIIYNLWNLKLFYLN
jgi:hypothetical protein